MIPPARRPGKRAALVRRRPAAVQRSWRPPFRGPPRVYGPPSNQQKKTPVTVLELHAMRQRGERIVALTAYDYTTARVADEAGVDVLLVGDSLGMVVLGYDSTLPVTMEEMLDFTRAAARAADIKPFASSMAST